LGYWFVSVFGSWKEWRVQMGIIIAVTVGVFFLLLCCVVPFLRSMLASAAAKQMINVSVKPSAIDIGCTNSGVSPIGPGLDKLGDFL